MAKLNLSSIVLVLTTVAATGQAETIDRTADQNAIRQVVARYLDARNHADPAKTRDVLTPDADQLVSSGEWRRGRDSLLEGAMAMSNKHTAQSSIHLDAVRFVTDDVAIADGDYVTHSAPGATRKMRTTFIMKRAGGKWKIAAIRNMLPAPLAR